MKRCGMCNKEAPDAADRCPACGGPLRPSSPATEQQLAQFDLEHADEDQLRRMLQLLQSDVKTQEARIGRLRIVGTALVAVLVLLLGSIYIFRVMRYATVKSVSIEKDSTAPGSAIITYSPSSEGRVDFLRISGVRREELAEHLTAPLENKFAFHWGGESEGGYDIHVIYRRGVFLKKEKRHFEN